MCTGAEIAALIGAAASVAGAGTGIASAAGAFGRPAGPTMPPAAPVDTSQIAKALLPGTRADAAARLGGGLSSSYLSDELSKQVGVPGAGTGVLEDIRKSLGEGA